jgi:hypothetical protein
MDLINHGKRTEQLMEGTETTTLGPRPNEKGP